MTSNTASPNARTIWRAKWGPIPLTIPEPRYFSIPSRVVGGTTVSRSARNCSPCCRSLTHSPWASMYSPAETAAALPMTVTTSRWPLTCTRSTQNPDCSL